MKLTNLKETFDRLFQIPFKLINYDANADNRYRYRDPINDSHTRAMSAVLSMKYEEVLEEQFKTAAFLRCDSNHIAVMDFMMEKHGYRIYKFERRYSVLTFILNNPEGRFIINTEDGALAVVNATIIDVCPNDISSGDYLESVLCRMVIRAYEIAPLEERYIAIGDPGHGELKKVSEMKQEEISVENESEPVKTKKAKSTKSKKKTSSKKSKKATSDDQK